MTDEAKRILAMIVALGGVAHRSTLICAFEQMVLTGCCKTMPVREPFADALLWLRYNGYVELTDDGFRATIERDE